MSELEHDQGAARTRLSHCRQSLNGVIREVRGFISGLEPEQMQRHLGAPSAAERLVPARPHTWVEVEIAVYEEMAMTLGDVLVRRLGLFYETPDQGLLIAGAVTERIGGLLGWDSTRTEQEARAYEDLVRAHQGFRVDHGG